MRLVSFIRRARAWSSLPPGVRQSGREPSGEPDRAGTLIWDSQASRTVRNKYSLFKPPNQWYFVTAVSQTKTSWKCLFPQCQIQTFSSNHELGNWPDIIKNMFKKCHLLPAQTSCLETLGVCSGGSVPPQAQSPSAIGLRQLCDEWWEQESGKIPNNLKLHLKKLEKGTIKTQSN